jgi:hypothetical protein
VLVFVIPLKSARVSNSWERVTQLFERCVKSVCNQTSPNFHVIVVCHEKPKIEFTHSHLTYITVDFSPANETNPVAKGAEMLKADTKLYIFAYTNLFNNSGK